LERGPYRFDYFYDQGVFSSTDEVVALDPHSFAAKEINFLKRYAESYGYQQLGRSWLQVRIADK